MRKLIFIVCLILCDFADNAQNSSVIDLKRSVFPIYSYTKIYQHPFEHDSIPYKNGAYRQIDNYKVIAGDYSDSKAKFTIALNSMQCSQVKHGMFHSPFESDSGFYQVYIAPYKADSVYIVPCNPKDAEVKPLKPFIVAIGKQEYNCILSQDIKKIFVLPLTDGWVTPKFKLYNDSLPNDTFQALGGKQTAFKEFENKGKYIYIMTWSPDLMTGRPGTELNFLRDASEKFKDKLTAIIFVPDGDEWQKLEIAKEGTGWYVSTLMFFPGCDFQFNFSPNGVLFNSDGTIANRGILPSELKGFLNKLIKN